MSHKSPKSECALQVESESSGSGGSLSDQALVWVVRLHSGEASPDDRRAYMQWRDSSPHHDAAARQAEQLWSFGGSISTEKATGFARLKDAPPADPGRRRMLVLTGMGIAAGSIGGAGWLTMRRPVSDLMTATAENRHLVLQGNVAMTLAALSGVDVRTTADGSGSLVLNEGQAFFEIQPSTEPTPIVQSRGVDIRTHSAAGFEIDVRRQADTTVITVAEGRILVVTRPPAPFPAESIELAAGNSIDVSGNGRVAARRNQEPTVTAAWRNGLLIAQNQPLNEVVAGLAPYHSGRITISSMRAAALRCNVVLSLYRPQEALQVLAGSLPITVKNYGGYLTVIGSA